MAVVTSAAAVMVAAAPPVAADIVIEVTNGSDSGPGSYRQAILTANTNGDTQPDIIDFDEDLSVVLTSGNVLYTGAQRITLKGHGSSIDGSGAFRILGAQVGSVTIDDLELTRGDADIGGAVATNGSLVVRDSELTRSSAGIGGAVFADDSLTISDSEFSHNEGIIGGAAVAVRAVEISHSEFSSNHASQGAGGAVASATSVEADDTLFQDDTAVAGGSIAVASVIFVSFSGTASAQVDTGSIRIGDVVVFDDDDDDDEPASENFVELDGVTIADEEATVGGGVALGGNLDVIDGVVTLVGPASLVAVNSTFTDNEASQAGGVLAVPDGDVTLTYVTSSHNEAPDGAQVLATELTSFATEYGTDDDDDNCDVEDTESEGYNFSTDDSCDLDDDTDREDAGDPVLGELADNGGPTPTQLPLTGSPLIDAIPLDVCQDEDVDEDQRDVARPQGEWCDIGAVEVELVDVPVSIVVEPTFTG